MTCPHCTGGWRASDDEAASVTCCPHCDADGAGGLAPTPTRPEVTSDEREEATANLLATRSLLSEYERRLGNLRHLERKLLARCLEAGISKAELARLLGLSRQRVGVLTKDLPLPPVGDLTEGK
jgi:DNA-directed RNA polymerase specialized sigma24 family protein